MATQIFVIFTPIWGRWTQFDEHIFSKGLKPPTSYEDPYITNQYFMECQVRGEMIHQAQMKKSHLTKNQSSRTERGACCTHDHCDPQTGAISRDSLAMLAPHHQGEITLLILIIYIYYTFLAGTGESEVQLMVNWWFESWGTIQMSYPFMTKS